MVPNQIIKDVGMTTQRTRSLEQIVSDTNGLKTTGPGKAGSLRWSGCVFIGEVFR